MTRRDMVVQAVLVFGLIVGIVGGNFVLHRWVLGNATSREAEAGTTPANLALDDLAEFAPPSRAKAQPVDSTVHREQLRQLIAEKLPEASVDERETWLDELSDVSLSAAAGILELRGEIRESKANTPTPERIPFGISVAPNDIGRGITPE